MEICSFKDEISITSESPSTVIKIPTTEDTKNVKVSISVDFGGSIQKNGKMLRCQLILQSLMQ